MPEWTIKRGGELVATPWRNGLGTTCDVITVVGPDGALRWQVSIAELVQDAEFSHFPHCDRIFTPIAGQPPPELAIDGGDFEACPLMVPKRFAGDVATRSRVPVPGRAFNAVWDRRIHTVAVAVLRSSGNRVDWPGSAHTVIYCQSGCIEFGVERLETGDSLVGLGWLPSFQVEGTSLMVSVGSISS